MRSQLLLLLLLLLRWLQYHVDEVRHYEEHQTPGDHKNVAQQSPAFYRSFRQPADASPAAGAPVSSGARQLDQLVQSEYERAAESQRAAAAGGGAGGARGQRAALPVGNVLEPEPDGLLRYIRACYQKVPADELQLMCKELTSLLGMFQATGKLETTDWDAFPAPF